VENAGKQVLGKRFVGVDVPASRRSKRSHCRSVLRHMIGWEILFGNEMEGLTDIPAWRESPSK
jgi:hypothetical protein